MNADINRNITSEIPHEDFSVDFETERTPVRLGKSNRYMYVDFNDTGFPVRLSEARDKIVNFLEEKQREYGIEDINNPKPNLNTAENNMVALKTIDNFIKEQINYAFGYDVSADVFGIAFCTSITKNGECYYENFFNSILPLIEQQFNVRINKFSARTKTYLEKKGSHPAYKK